MSHYQQHIFFCNNWRQQVHRNCCRRKAGGEQVVIDMVNYAKQLIAQLAPEKSSDIKISLSGCMGRCALGPVLVIYPQGDWYTYASKADIKTIITDRVLQGHQVTALQLDRAAKID